MKDERQPKEPQRGIGMKQWDEASGYAEFRRRVRERTIRAAVEQLGPETPSPQYQQNPLDGLTTVVASNVSWSKGDFVGSAEVQVERFSSLWELHFYFEANEDPALTGWVRHSSYNISLGDHELADAPEPVWNAALRALP